MTRANVLICFYCKNGERVGLWGLEPVTVVPESFPDCSNAFESRLRCELVLTYCKLCLRSNIRYPIHIEVSPDGKP